MAKILIVDDEVSILELIRSKLKSVGYQVIEAETGTQAVESTLIEKPDLILLDILLPEIDGFEVFRRLRSDESTKHIPIIFLTGKPLERDVVKGLELGAEDYILKPFSLQELAARVHRALATQTAAETRVSEVTRVELEKRAKIAGAFEGIAHALSSMKDKQMLLQYVLEQALALTEARSGSIMMVGKDGRLQITNSVGISPEIVRTSRTPLGQGIAGLVAASGQPLAVENVKEDTRFARFRRDSYETGAFASVPLKRDSQVIGVMNVSDKKEQQKFGQDELETLSSLGANATMALENADLYRQVAETKDSYLALMDAANIIIKGQDIDHILKALIGQAAGMIGAGTGLLFLPRSEGQVLELAVATGRWEGEGQGLRYQLGAGLIGQTAKAKKPIVVEEWSRETDPLRRYVSKVMTKPLLADGGLLGVAALADKEGDRSFNDSDLDYLHPVFRELTAILKVKDLAATAGGEPAKAPALNDAEKLKHLQGEFCSTVAHEIRTPLTSISGFSDLLLESRGSLADRDVEHYLRTIKDEASRLATFIEEMLDVSKLETGTAALRLEPVDLKQVIESVVSLMEARLAAHKVTLDIPEGLPKIAGDRDKVRQVFINLLTNASNYAPAGQSISINVRLSGKYLKIKIADTGVGIPVEEQHKIFDKFYRVDNEVNRQVAGTGLGLTIVKQILEAHGGYIFVESDGRNGARFNFTLPTV